MQAFEVGKPYPPARGMIDGSMCASLDGATLMLMLCFEPSQEEIEAYRSGRVECGVVIENHYLAIAYKNELGFTGDATYAIGLEPHVELPPAASAIAEGMGMQMLVIVVEPRTTIVRVVRLLGLSTKISRAISDAVREHRMHARRDRINAKLNEYEGKYRDAEAVLRAASKTGHTQVWTREKMQ